MPGSKEFRLLRPRERSGSGLGLGRPYSVSYRTCYYVLADLPFNVIEDSRQEVDWNGSGDDSR